MDCTFSVHDLLSANKSPKVINNLILSKLINFTLRIALKAYSALFQPVMTNSGASLLVFIFVLSSVTESMMKTLSPHTEV